MANVAQKHSPRRWAILIGINLYINDRCLEGCARDVELAEHYLRTASWPVDIVTFTATKLNDDAIRRPQEQAAALPTYENVTASLKKVLDRSESGDLVYIHYSGHGARKVGGEEHGSVTGNLALVLYDDRHGSRYLYGSLLASALHKMAIKGLVVTMVFDCCFSGSAMRNGDTCVRTTQYDPAIEAAYPPEESDLRLDDSAWSTRDGHHLPSWLVNPSGYTILAACGPHEVAEELASPEQEKRGALSYFLFQALVSLRRNALDVNYSFLYQHILTKFHIAWPQQTPMHYGNKHFGFFGNVMVESEPKYTPIFKAKDGQLCLRAGHVHGVNLGDQYAVYPFDSPEDLPGLKSTTGEMFTVDSVECLKSNLKSVKRTAVLSYANNIGLKAKLITQFPSWSMPVQVPLETYGQLKAARDVDQQRLVEYIAKGPGSKRCVFGVHCNVNGDYEVFDAAFQQIPTLPVIPTSRENALEEVLNLLEHLAKFKHFEAVENRLPDPVFEQSFLIWTDAVVGTTGSYETNDGESWTFKIKNLCDKAIYLTVFDLYPSWHIKNLLGPSDGEFLVVEPNDQEEVTIEMKAAEVLSNGGRCDCQDVIKVFITGSAIPFPSTILAPISLPGGGSGMRSNADQLSRCLSMLDSTNQGANRSDWATNWTSRNFLVRTIAR
ncbi:hypothetical protein MMC10_005585 [Thelotrema lepadinum]|nr:hypothetical protein [Thelotrema lepadinum]